MKHFPSGFLHGGWKGILRGPNLQKVTVDALLLVEGVPFSDEAKLPYLHVYENEDVPDC